MGDFFILESAAKLDDESVKPLSFIEGFPYATQPSSKRRAISESSSEKGPSTKLKTKLYNLQRPKIPSATEGVDLELLIP